MFPKAPLSREARIEKSRRDELDRAAGMRDYLEQREVTDANTARLRALRLAKEAADSEAAPAKRPAPKKKDRPKRGVGSH